MIADYNKERIEGVNLSQVENLDFSQLVFRQIDRIGWSKNITEFRFQVFKLKAMVKHLINDNFIIRRGLSQEALEKEFPTNRMKNTQKYVYAYSHKLLECIVELLNEKSWIGFDKIIEWVGFKDKKTLWLFNQLEKRYKRKLNSNIWFGGKPGSGKSESALSFCIAYATWCKRKWIIAKTREDLIRYAHDKTICPDGTIIFWDEMGTQANKRSWWKNLQLQELFQTFRARKLILVMTAPMFDDVDGKINQFFDYVFELNKNSVRIDEDYAVCKFFEVSTKQQYGKGVKIFKKYPKVEIGIKRELKQIFRIIINAPPKDKVKEYRKVKKEYYAMLGIKSLKKIKKDKLGQEKKKKEIFDPLPHVQRIKNNYDSFINKHGRVTTAKIMAVLGISQPKAQQIRSLLEESHLSTTKDDGPLSKNND